MELIAEPDDYQAKLAAFSDQNLAEFHAIDKHKEEESQILFDDLFFSSDDLKNPTVFLEGNDKIFYWNMKNGELSLSDINRGRRNFEIDGNEILQDSIRVRIAREPYKTINLKLRASWIQYEYGNVDLLPMIAQKFERRLINSFTNIKSGIANLFSEKNGYRLAYCNINEINPNAAGVLSDCPVLSPDFYYQANAAAERKKVRFKRFYFDGKLVIDWAYKQKRVETVNVKVVNKSVDQGREKNIYLKLKAIQAPKKYPVWNCFTYYGEGDKTQYKNEIFECSSASVSNENFEPEKWRLVQKMPDALRDDSSSSFFATARGKNAIKYAAQKAIALINYSSRYVEIDFCVEAKKFIDASVDDQITILDDRFSNGRIAGKIVKTRFIGDAERKIIKFTIGCATADVSQNFEKLNGVKIEIPNDESRINPADIVRKIEIINPPEEQLAALSSATHRSVSELKSELNKRATKIKVSLHPLTSTRVVTREVNLPEIAL